MSYLQQTRMVIGHDNRTNYAGTTAVVSLFCNEVGGMPAENLRYADPHLIAEFNPDDGGDPYVRINYTPFFPATCCGVVNHNFFSQGYDGIRFFRDGVTIDSTWLDITSDANILIRHDGVNATGYAFEIRSTVSPAANFRIGSFFAGTYYEVTKNPMDKLFFEKLEAPMIVERSAGDALTVIQTTSKLTHPAEISFQRAPQTQVQFLCESLIRNNHSKMIAIVQPDQVDVQYPTGPEHIFGYLQSVERAPGSNYGEGQKSDVIMRILGAV